MLAILGHFVPFQAPAVEAMDRVLNRMEGLSAADQAVLVEEIQAGVLAGNHPRLEALRNLAQWAEKEGLEAKPISLAYFQAEKYAPALRLRTRIMGGKDRKWKSLKIKYFRNSNIPWTPTIWAWDHGRNRLRSRLNPLGPRDILRALLEGQIDPEGRLAAMAEGFLDHDSGMDAEAWYFEHCYRDRDGLVFSGIRLFDMWGTTREIEISDVEAIAWLRRVAGEEKLRSPIPKRLHDPIYSRIHDSFEKWREYRELRRALAVRLVDPGGEVPPVWGPVVERLDRAWVDLKMDPAEMRKFLEAHPKRDRFLVESKLLTEAVDAEISADGREPWREEKFSTCVARLALKEARALGLLGAGIR